MTRTSQNRQRYTPWRYFAPASILINDGDGEFQLPESSIPQVLQLTGFKDLAAMQKTISRHQRSELPEDLQERLSRVFVFEADDAACKEKLRVQDSEGNDYVLPFPFAVAEEVPLKLEIYDFWLENKDGYADLYFRAGLEAPAMLKPRNKAALKVCDLLTGDDFANPDDDGRNAIAAWLRSNHVSEELVNDDDFLENLYHNIHDRLDYLIWLNVVDELASEDNLPVIGGEEERGFSKDESAAD
jgi:hypothetical protein